MGLFQSNILVYDSQLLNIAGTLTPFTSNNENEKEAEFFLKDNFFDENI